MITLQETTAWDGNIPNHKYIVSDDKRWMYGYIKVGNKYPDMFNKPIGFDVRGRKFVEVLRTRDVVEQQEETGKVYLLQGSKGVTHTVTFRDGGYSCSCPAATFRRQECKHIQSIKSSQ